MGDNLVNLRAGALGILSLLLAGCVSAGSDTASSQNNFGYKTIYIGQDADVKLLRSVLNDWEEIAEAIYRYQPRRSEEHTSELQSRGHLVCRLLLEKKNTTDNTLER